MTETNWQNSPPQYHSYLLRIWVEDAGSQTPWRIVLINLQMGTRQGFVDLEQLANFLKQTLPEDLK